MAKKLAKKPAAPAKTTTTKRKSSPATKPHGKPLFVLNKRATKTKSPKQKTAPEPEQKCNPHATRGTGGEEVKILERRYFVWDLYKAGASFRQISEHLKSKNYEGTSIGTVHTDLQWCLDQQHNDLALDVKHHIENEVAIINEVQFSFYPIVKNSSLPFDIRLEAGGMVLDCVKERSKLRNLYKPKEINLKVEDELAKLLGLEPEELPDSETDVNQTEH